MADGLQESRKGVSWKRSDWQIIGGSLLTAICRRQSIDDNLSDGILFDGRVYGKHMPSSKVKDRNRYNLRCLSFLPSALQLVVQTINTVFSERPTHKKTEIRARKKRERGGRELGTYFTDGNIPFNIIFLKCVYLYI